jgi:hypothetical protein
MERVLVAVRSAVAARRPSAVVAADLLYFASVGMDAAGWPNPSESEQSFVFDVAADAMATREVESFR